MKEKKHKLSKIENMWLFAMFDLPVTNNEARREYSHFRKLLLSEGFTMLQFSVYARFCGSRESGNVFFKHIKDQLPPEGQVRLLTVTDKQFGEMAVFYGTSRKKAEDQPEQLLLF